MIRVLFQIMFVCYVCSKSEETIAAFRSHLQYHNVIGELKLPLLCVECKSSFAKIYTLIRHVQTYHRDTKFAGPQNPAHDDRYSSDVVTVDDDGCNVESVSGENYLEHVRNEGVALVASLRANSSIPFTVIPSVIDSINHMSASLSSFCQSEAISSMVNAGIDEHVINSVKMQLNASLECTSKPLDFLSSRYKQDKFFNGHPLAVTPETVSFGVEIASHSGNSQLISESFQYVSVEKTLRSLLQSEEYVKLLLSDDSENGVIRDYADGQLYKLHPLFSDSGKLSLMIQLFYDGLGVTNPLRGQSTLHNVGVFFYTIRNLSQKHNSCFANVHLLALCYSLDLKKYGFDPILEKFVDEVNRLSRVGFAGSFPVIGQCTVFASLCQVTCDNLALNGILGFIESFSCDHFCTLCYATQDDIQTKFYESEFMLRTLSTYKCDVSRLTQSSCKHVRGVKKECKLNNIDGFHITKNWSLDIMHIILEGIVPYELSCIFSGLFNTINHLDMETVNCEIQLFWGKITVEKSNKPLELNKIDDPSHGLSPSMKAMQYWALLKYLSLILGSFVLPCSKNQHWEFLLHLSHLVDLIFSPKFTPGIISYFRCVIADHLHMFVNLYGGQGNIRLRPKHHLLIHLPTIVTKSGPLTGMSCFRYELKNSFFKRSAHISCNFTNICQTLAYRHQQRALYSLLSNENIRDVPIVPKHKPSYISSLQYRDSLCNKFDLSDSDKVNLASKVFVASVEYKVGDFVAVSQNSETKFTTFGKICAVVMCPHSGKWYLVVQMFHTLDFYAHVHAYCVSDLNTDEHKILALDQLLDYHPLYCHVREGFDGVKRKYIRSPYHIF